MKVGVYFYSQSINKTEIDEEISAILEIIKDYDITYPVCIYLDRFAEGSIENKESRASILSDEEYINLVKYFSITINQKGYIQYTSRDSLTFLLNRQAYYEYISGNEKRSQAS